MGFLDFGSNKVSTSVRKRVNIAATPIGKQKMERFEGEGPKFQVLATVVDQGPCTIEEICAECHLSYPKAKVVVQDLIKDGYVRIMGNNEPLQPVGQ